MASSIGNAEKRKQPSDDSPKEETSVTSLPPKKLAISLKPKTPSSKPLFGSSSGSGSPSGLVNIERKPSQPINAKKSNESKAIFDADDDSDETEEMPAECKMRMRNVGRDTPTSSGPNSFSKGKQGFIDERKLAERRIQEMIDQLGDKSS